MDDATKIQRIIELVMQSDLDQTIKDILVRDLQSEGLTDFLKEQIKAYCAEGLKRPSKVSEHANQILNDTPAENPAA